MTNVQNIKNFIRQGRQARDIAPDTVINNSSIRNKDIVNGDLHVDDLIHQQINNDNNNNNYTTNNTKNIYDYNELANELVKQEQSLPQSKYPGLENYNIIDKLGEGAFSTVHKALNLITNELVAIKIIKKLQLDSNQKRAVLKEATIMRQLNHENIVKFIEFKEVSEFYYIIQELVEGGEIFNEIVKYTYLSEDLSRHVIQQVGEAIKYLHEEIGVVHRDIKPENLLFQPIRLIPSTNKKLRRSDDPNKVDEGEFINGIGGGGIGLVKLADFGLSKQIWYDETKTPCGTVGYTAPEIVRDEHYSKEVDMWALGCVLYTLLCGFPPFYDEKIDVLTEKVAKGEFQFLQPWWDEISVGAKNCVKNLLTVDPTKRYNINQFLNDPWLNKVEFKRPKKSAYNENNFQQYRRTEHAYSPAARALKDAFDISNEIHRIGEEKLINKRRFANDFTTDDNLIREEEEEEDLEEEVLEALKPQYGDLETKSGRYIKEVDFRQSKKNPNLQHQQQQQVDAAVHNNHAFELSLDTSTIINRRKKKLTS